MASAFLLELFIFDAWLLLPAQIIVGATLYLAMNAAIGNDIQREVLSYAFGRFLRKKA